MELTFLVPYNFDYFTVMKKIDTTARYYETNEWARQQNAHFIIGITDFAQVVFGDIVFIELPQIGQVFQQGTPFAVTESNKAANDISMPLSGQIIEINSDLPDHPEWMNEAPYDKGWLVKIKATNPTEWEQLMNAEQYAQFIGLFFNKT